MASVGGIAAVERHRKISGGLVPEGPPGGKLISGWAEATSDGSASTAAARRTPVRYNAGC